MLPFIRRRPRIRGTAFVKRRTKLLEAVMELSMSSESHPSDYTKALSEESFITKFAKVKTHFLGNKSGAVNYLEMSLQDPIFN